ncbi:MAG: aminopeptidase [Bacteroidetes bacterium]|nr:aminopeptidase [Bacteroidota bacterium]
MASYKEEYIKKTEEVKTEYSETLEKISGLNSRTAEAKNEFEAYVNRISGWILKTAKLEADLRDENYFTSKSFEQLYEINKDLYSDLHEKNYSSSYVNPDFAVKIFGEKTGKLITFFTTYFKLYIEYAFEHRILHLNKYNNYFVNASEIILKNDFTYEELYGAMTAPERENKVESFRFTINQDYNPEMNPLRDIYLKTDFNDLRYLFRYGKHITENEIKTAKYLADYPDEKIKAQAKSIVKAYIRGFELEQKDLTNKKTVSYVSNIGMERLSFEIIKELERNNLTALLANIQTTSSNKQYRYDHRFDIALYLTEEFVENMDKANEKALESEKELLSGYSGIIMFDRFGEKPFAPVNKESTIKLSPEQTKLYRKFVTNFRANMDKFVRSNETSFTAVSLPSPEIGDDFEKIFDGIVEINMMDTDHHESIQKNIIDVLDKAVYVEVKGKDKNETLIRVSMHELKNPEEETNFLNIGADKNIPVGEVFTSPVLKGTDGILHFEEIFLRSLKFENLRLRFKDGFIEEYSCTNFGNNEENKKFVEENLLFPHKTLPLGEFAIGTNTAAYKLAKEFDIINILPILIIEKMGPHFAIGDTCFMWQEDHRIYNVIDHKEMIAKDNEKSILRKQDIMQAYTNVHTDMTLPYESIEYIASVKKDGTKDYIIKDGIFVVPGTEELNQALLN